MKGSIKEFDKVEMTVEDIFPMDKGTTGSTGYELGDEIIEYRMNNPASLGWKMGMIHSHHNMNSYFSGVDMSELDDNTEFHNYYLSLVVNNRREMVAKVAFRGDVKGYECKDEEGKAWNLKLTKDRQVMFTFDCEISSPEVVIPIPGDFKKRTSEIIEQANKKHKSVIDARDKFQNQKTSMIPYKQHNGKQFNSWQQEQKIRRMREVDSFDDVEGWNNSFGIDSDVTELVELDRVKEFVRYLLRLGDPIEGKDTLEAALEDTEILIPIEKGQYVQRVLVMYPALFEKYWDIFGEINTEKFFDITTDVTDILLEYEGTIDVVESIVKGLDAMLEKM